MDFTSDLTKNNSYDKEKIIYNDVHLILVKFSVMMRIVRHWRLALIHALRRWPGCLTHPS